MAKTLFGDDIIEQPKPQVGKTTMFGDPVIGDDSTVSASAHSTAIPANLPGIPTPPTPAGLQTPNPKSRVLAPSIDADKAVRQAYINSAVENRPGIPGTSTGFGPGQHAAIKLPQELESPQQTRQRYAAEGAATSYQNPRTGKRFQPEANDVRAPIIDSPLTAYDLAKSGVTKIGSTSQASEAAVKRGATPLTPIEESRDKFWGGTADLAQAGMEAASPFLPEQLLTHPARTLFSLGAGTLAGKGTEAVTGALGASPGVQRFFGTAAGLGAGALTATKGAELPQALGEHLNKVNPNEALTQAHRPANRLIDYDNTLTLGRPEAKQSEVVMTNKDGSPFKIVDTRTELAAIQNAKKRNRLGWEAIEGPVGHHMVDQSSATDAAEAAIRNSTLKTVGEDAIAAKVEPFKVYRNGMTVDESETELQRYNADLNAYEAQKYPHAKYVDLRSDPEVAGKVAARDAIRENLYNYLEQATGTPATRDFKKRYGALLEMEQQNLRRQVINDRQAPSNLAQQLSTIRAAGQGGKGAVETIGGVATGHPGLVVRGLAKTAEALIDPQVADWLRERNSTNGLIRRAYEQTTERNPTLKMPQRPAPAGLLGPSTRPYSAQGIDYNVDTVGNMERQASGFPPVQGTGAGPAAPLVPRQIGGTVQTPGTAERPVTQRGPWEPPPGSKGVGGVQPGQSSLNIAATGGQYSGGASQWRPGMGIPQSFSKYLPPSLEKLRFKWPNPIVGPGSTAEQFATQSGPQLPETAHSTIQDWLQGHTGQPLLPEARTTLDPSSKEAHLAAALGASEANKVVRPNANIRIANSLTQPVEGGDISNRVYQGRDAAGKVQPREGNLAKDSAQAFNEAFQNNTEQAQRATAIGAGPDVRRVMQENADADVHKAMQDNASVTLNRPFESLHPIEQELFNDIISGAIKRANLSVADGAALDTWLSRNRGNAPAPSSREPVGTSEAADVQDLLSKALPSQPTPKSVLSKVQRPRKGDTAGVAPAPVADVKAAPVAPVQFTDADVKTLVDQMKVEYAKTINREVKTGKAEGGQAPKSRVVPGKFSDLDPKIQDKLTAQYTEKAKRILTEKYNSRQ